MAKLRIVNGEFYRGEDKVPVVIGDPEQIECLQAANRELEILSTNGRRVEVGLDVCASVHFKCPCGSTVYFESNGNDSEDQALDDLDGAKETCICGAKYRLSYDDDDNTWVVSKID